MLSHPSRALVPLAVSLLCSTACAAPPVVAVLREPGMPYFMAASALDPDSIIDLLNHCGLKAVGLNAQQVADAGRFSAMRYGALVLPYGNTFPQPIAANFTRFHKAGGSLISLGVPFTHPCTPSGPVGWSPIAGGSRDCVTRDVEAAHSGQYGLRVERHGLGPSVWAGCISERFAAREGEQFEVAAWVRTKGKFGPQDCLYVRFFGQAGKFLGQTGPVFPDDSSSASSPPQWSRLSKIVTAAPGTRTVDVCVALFSTGTAWIDEARLERCSEPGVNLLRDGGFEGCVTGVWADSGHSEAYRKHDGTGAGGYSVVQGCDGFGAEHTRQWLGLSPDEFTIMPPAPAICVADFPEDEVIGIAGPTSKGQVLGYSTALIRHRCEAFRGAVDFYASTQSPPPSLAMKLIVCGTARAFRERGLLTDVEMQRVQARASRWIIPTPPVVTLPPRPKTWRGIFPKPREPAHELYLLDLESSATPHQLTFTALQGLLNRSIPRVYIDDEWSKDLRSWGYELAPIDGWDLLRKFRSTVRGIAVYDPSLPASANVAVTLCAVKGWLPVQPSQLGEIGPRGRQVRLPVKADLRGRWNTEAEAYRWALKHLRPLCTSRVLCHEKQMEPLTPDAPKIALTLVDYVVQQKVYSFHLNSSWSAADRQVAEALLATYPANIPIIGHFGPEPSGAPNLANEGEIVDLASRFAKFYVFLVSHNASVHAGFPTTSLRQRHPETPALDTSKVYVTPYLSDGDSPTTWYAGRGRWSDPARGKVPIAWSLGPTALELYPKAMQWFYDHLSDNDCFVAACSGAGYCYPHVYGARIRNREVALREYLRLTDQQMRQADLSITHIHHVSGCSEADIDRYAREVTCLQGVLADYGKVVPDYARSCRMSERRVPVFHALTTFTPPDKGTQAEKWVSEIAQATPSVRPAFLHFFAVVWYSTPSDVAATLSALDPQTYLAVRPDAMSALFRNSQGPIQSPTPANLRAVPTSSAASYPSSWSSSSWMACRSGCPGRDATPASLYSKR